MDTFTRISLINKASLAYALVLVLMLVLAVSRRGATKKRRLLIVAMWFHAIATAARLVSWCIVRRPGFVIHVALVCCMTCADAFSILTCLYIMNYIYSDVSGHAGDLMEGDGLIKMLLALNGVNLFLALSNPLTHVYNWFDAANVYRAGPLYWLRDLLFFVQALCMIPVVVRLRERNGRAMTVRLLACGSLTTLSVLFELLLPGISLLFPAVSLMLVLLATGVQGRLEEELAQARAEAAESRVRLLSGQINRHFVFNSLTAIKQLVAEDPGLAEDAIQDFSDYLRSHLDVLADARLVPISDELDHVRHYVALEQADYVRPLEVRYELETIDFEVPPLTVQPLVENAIRHGIRTREDGGAVVVATFEHDDSFEVRVTDDGHGFSSATARQDERQRVGIANVRERIARQCGGRLDVSSDDSGTVARLIIPRSIEHEGSHR